MPFAVLVLPLLVLAGPSHAAPAADPAAYVLAAPTAGSLTLAFDEIRQFGVSSVQVMRRLRAALIGLMDSVTEFDRRELVQRYLHHLDLVVEHSMLDAEDRVVALQEDRQGLGLSRRRAESTDSQPVSF